MRILPITDKHADYAHALKKKMFDLGLRVEVDDRSEKIGYKIRESQVLKTPYTLVVGDQEVASGTAAVRKYGEKTSETMPVDAFIDAIQKKIAAREQNY